jgi:hypothetical protein
MTELKMTHVLLFIVAAFLLYHSMSGCGNGFSLGGQNAPCKCGDGPYYYGKNDHSHTNIRYNSTDSQCEIPLGGGTIANWNASKCTGIHDKTQCIQKRIESSWWHKNNKQSPPNRACKWDDNYKPPPKKECSKINAQTDCNSTPNCKFSENKCQDKQCFEITGKNAEADCNSNPYCKFGNNTCNEICFYKDGVGDYCHNSGTCKDKENGGRECECQPEWEGDYCNESI